MDWLTDPSIWASLATLTLLEVVLGIDNVVFISILSNKLPEEQRKRARMIGLGIAMLARVLLLLSLSWVMGLTKPLFTLGFGLDHAVSGRDLILLGGGLFLLGKSTMEIHGKIEGKAHDQQELAVVSFRSVIIQILILDLVFSLDSVITAIGMADVVPVMIAAIVIAVIVMMLAAERISAFLEKHPTLVVLALSFLLLIGFTLVAEGLHLHVPKGYIYFAMTFSVLVEALNLRMRARSNKSKA